MLPHLARSALLSTITVATGVPPALAGEIFDTRDARVEAEIVTDQLENPWGLDFLPGGEVMVTERAGRIRLLSDGKLSKPLKGVPKVAASRPGRTTRHRSSLPDFAAIATDLFQFFGTRSRRRWNCDRARETGP